MIDSDPASEFAWHNLGLAFNLQGEQSKAARAYREAIKADPSHAPSLSNLAVVLANSGRADEAEKYLREAIEARPRYVEAYGNLGAILGAFERYGEAVAIYEKAVSLTPIAALFTTIWQGSSGRRKNLNWPGVTTRRRPRPTTKAPPA